MSIVASAFLTPALVAHAEDPRTSPVIGGELLGRPGTQARTGGDVPPVPEDLTAESWLVADAETGEVLGAHDAHERLPPASTLKMLFADTLLPKFGREEVYRAEPEHFTDLGPGSSAVGIADHHTYTVEDLWHGVFLASGNDAVYALTAMNGGKEATVAEMNARAEELQAADTHVVNPDGYDARGQLSSAYDLTLIARSGLQNADFRAYAATGSAEFPGEGEGEDRETYEVQNTNRLLVGAPGLDRYQGIAGVKNGYTSAAGYTFTGVAERDGRVLLVTVMDPDSGDSLAVYRESAALLDWGFAAADTIEPVGELVPPLSALPAAADGGGRAGGEEPEGSAAGTGDGKNAGDVALQGAAGGDGAAAGPAVVAFTAAGIAVLAAAAWLFHRRHPLPLPARAPRPSRPPGGVPPE
ncbi:D-alanyl-D-alanine carboxypeptidase family protein [Streptomyces marincola]|uniref:D-alanyl-D-alanine carboxypeptidase n=1 Tax=Streptomyces marincola TaxID=2878388 RepID=A0A1W7CVX9_9ACTN|nr:serine hydrolase [Streptomyces marincola]ARQ68961.1 D-alanyl-D-alanine carboxypeptidase [Streptomyces marincola]